MRLSIQRIALRTRRLLYHELDRVRDDPTVLPVVWRGLDEQVITDKERHELAERIRTMHRNAPYIPFYVILQQAMNEMLPEGTNYCEALADLIDLPN